MFPFTICLGGESPTAAAVLWRERRSASLASKCALASTSGRAWEPGITRKCASVSQCVSIFQLISRYWVLTAPCCLHDTDI